MKYTFTISVLNNLNTSIGVFKCTPNTDDLIKARLMIAESLKKKYGDKYGGFKELTCQVEAVPFPPIFEEIFGKGFGK